MNAGLPVWPLFIFGGLLTVIAAGIFVAIFLSARNEGDNDGQRTEAGRR